MTDTIINPAHYTVYPVQPIEICRHLTFCLGNAVKYVLRAPYKGGIEDCRKAIRYLGWVTEYEAAQMINHQHPEYKKLNEKILALAEYLRTPENRQPHSVSTIVFLRALDGLLEGKTGYLPVMLEAVEALSEKIQGRNYESSRK